MVCSTATLEVKACINKFSKAFRLLVLHQHCVLHHHVVSLLLQSSLHLLQGGVFIISQCVSRSNILIRCLIISDVFFCKLINLILRWDGNQELVITFCYWIIIILMVLQILTTKIFGCTSLICRYSVLIHIFVMLTIQSMDPYLHYRILIHTTYAILWGPYFQIPAF